MPRSTVSGPALARAGRLLSSGLILAALAACAEPGPTGLGNGPSMSKAERMRLACQTQPCLCVGEGGMFDSQPDRAPEWTDGEPFCPDGYELERIER